MLPLPSNDLKLEEFRPGVILLGRAQKFLRVIVRRQDDTTRKFLNTISLGLKGGLERPGDDRCETDLAGTCKKLFMQPAACHIHDHQRFSDYFNEVVTGLTEDSISKDCDRHPSVGVSGFLLKKSLRRRKVLDQLKRQIRRTVHEVFAGESFEIEDNNFVFPSTSANYVRNRVNGGSVIEVQRLLKKYLEESDQDVAGLNITPKKERHWVDFESPRDVKIIVCRGDGTEEMSSCVSGGFEDVDTYEVSGEAGMLRFQRNFYRYAVRQAWDEHPLVEPVALAEALKIRIITKCPPLLTFIMQPVQKWMAKCILKFRAFYLTGHPDDPTIISSVFGPKCDEGYKWLSGDYSAATDNIRGCLSDECAIAIGKHILPNDFESSDLQSKLRLLFKRSLTGFVLGIETSRYIAWCDEDLLDDIVSPNRYSQQYSAKARKNVLHAEWDQKDGQLMGSVTSFVVLCLINAALCRFCMELGSGKTFSLNNAPLLINGDDCVFDASNLTHALWLSLGPVCGLKPSMGKYYYTDRFLQINSRSYISRPCFDGSRLVNFWRVPFISYGLIAGKGRSIAKNGKDGESDVKLAQDFVKDAGSRYNKLMSLCPLEYRLLIHRRFVRKLRKMVQVGEVENIPWYLPTWYGGLGLNNLFNEPTDLDLRYVNLIRNHKITVPSLNQPSCWRMRHVLNQCYTPKFLHLCEEEGENVARLNTHLLFQALACLPAKSFSETFTIHKSDGNDELIKKCLSLFEVPTCKERTRRETSTGVPAVSRMWRDLCRKRVKRKFEGDVWESQMVLCPKVSFVDDVNTFSRLFDEKCYTIVAFDFD